MINAKNLSFYQRATLKYMNLTIEELEKFEDYYFQDEYEYEYEDDDEEDCFFD